MNRKTYGFTLVEFLVVLAILGLVATILFPTLAKAKRASSFAVSINQVRQLGFCTQLYRADYGGDGVIGDRYEMGLPLPFWPRESEYCLVPYGFKMELVGSPCGCHPHPATTGCSEEWNIEYSWSFTEFEREVLRYGEMMPAWFDVNCSDPDVRLLNEYDLKRGIAVRLNGTAVNKVNRGNPMLMSFYGQPEQ